MKPILMLSILITADLALGNSLLPAVRSWPSGAFASTQEPQQVTLLNNGVGSIYKRLQMIESATESIETEFYIYSSDQVGRLYTQALAKKAKQGVKVRVLIDALHKENLNSYEAHVMREAGIHVRFYNDASLLNIKKSNHRSHRKSLIIDGKEAVVGGRNMADGYFELDAKYNMMDRDAVIRGSLVKDIRQSFENFWNSELSKDAVPVTEPKLQEYGLQNLEDRQEDPTQMERFKKDIHDYKEGTQKAASFLITSDNDRENLQRIHLYGPKALEIAVTSQCDEAYVYADLPGTDKSARVVYHQIHDLLETAQKSIAVESPFFMQIEKEDPFHQALDRGLQVDVLSNSLHTTDVLLAIAPFIRSAKSLASRGAQVWVTDGEPVRWVDPSHWQAKVAVWGTHAKTVVIDRDTTLIGSFNMDPRSAYWNAEMAFVCRKNTALAEDVLLDIERRKSISVQLDGNGNPRDGREKFFDVSGTQRLKYILSLPITHLFEFLL